MSELTPKQLEAVSGIAKGLATRQIAKVVGVSCRTIERWRKLPEFVAAITRIQGNASRQVEAELVSDITCVTSRLENLASKSLDCLEQIIDNPEARNSDRIQASKIILSEWQRSQPPALHELAALESLIKAGYLSRAHLEKMREAVDLLTNQCRTILHEPTSTSVVGSEDVSAWE